MKFIEPDLAFKLIDEYELSSLSHEIVPLAEGLGRTLAEDVTSPFDQPAYDKALKDGYAYRSSDVLPEVVAVQKAGEDLGRKYSEGECIKIMTGAVVPKEFDMVVPVEDAEVESNRLKITGAVGNNICYQGEYVSKGERILHAGQKVASQTIGILASVGKREIKVYKKPRVGILVTGDELVEDFGDLAIGKKFDSNSPMLAAQVRELGAIPVEYRLVSDDLPATVDAIKQAVSECDLVLSSGGASMGDFDYIPRALQELGAKFIFQKMKFKPGKPTFFSEVCGKPYFALPGNQVSSFVVFHLFVSQLIKRLLGLPSNPSVLNLPMGKEFVRTKDLDRQEYRPVRIINGKVEVCNFVNSGHLLSLNEIEGLVEIRIDEDKLAIGSVQRVYLM